MLTLGKDRDIYEYMDLSIQDGESKKMVNNY